MGQKVWPFVLTVVIPASEWANQRTGRRPMQLEEEELSCWRYRCFTNCVELQRKSRKWQQEPDGGNYQMDDQKKGRGGEKKNIVTISLKSELKEAERHLISLSVLLWVVWSSFSLNSRDGKWVWILGLLCYNPQSREIHTWGDCCWPFRTNVKRKLWVSYKS